MDVPKYVPQYSAFREAARLEMLRNRNPERFEKARRLAEVTVFSLDDWLTEPDDKLDRAMKRAGLK